MCLIIHNPKAKAIDEDIIDCALMTNPDGFGIFFHDNGEIRKTMDWQRPLDWMAEGRPFTAHFRYATSGPVKKGNCHPFDIDDTYSLMMNGTIDRLKSTKQVDTQELCKILNGLSEEKMLAILATHPCRFALLNKVTGKATIVNNDLWTKHDGCLYSKANCLPSPNPKKSKVKAEAYSYDAWGEDEWSRWVDVEDEEWDEEWQASSSSDIPILPKGVLHTVAVYGTLKSGHGNHDRFLKDAYCLGAGWTCDRYPLIADGLPYLLDRKGEGWNVKVEVYRVDDSLLARLDGLEGHPNWYRRREIPIQLDKGGTVNAWTYLIPASSCGEFVNDNGEYLSCY
jgi:gamma-glutamylcyclotransferase (GGCT)/AIG2-like uncharacterized protein YtfP